MSKEVAKIIEVEGESNDCWGCCFHTDNFECFVRDFLGTVIDCHNKIFKIEIGE